MHHRARPHQRAGTHAGQVVELVLLQLLRKEDAAVLDRPAALARKLDDGALAVEKEEVFRVRDREGVVRALGAGGDFGADRVDEGLEHCSFSILIFILLKEK